MRRFFFDLQGTQNASDPTGSAFETELDAFRAAQRLAAELSSTRPDLRGSTWVVVGSEAGGGTMEHETELARQYLGGGDPQEGRRRLLRERVGRLGAMSQVESRAVLVCATKD